MWATLCHLSSFAGFVFPLGNIIAPLIIWVIKRDEHPLVADQGKEVLNFQISITIYMIISAFLVILVIGFVLLFIVGAFWAIMTIIAAVKTSEGEEYRYPLCIRLIQ
ncbi:MAG: DUF4870 domain-containing protein [candidate division Zixibacteria bacterium]|nr:DUF4870 domain-containing protein [candidate division Zixibacteria bacterium]